MKVTEKEDAKKQDSTGTEKTDKKEATKEVKEVKDADTLTFEGLHTIHSALSRALDCFELTSTSLIHRFERKCQIFGERYSDQRIETLGRSDAKPLLESQTPQRSSAQAHYQLLLHHRCISKR